MSYIRVCCLFAQHGAYCHFKILHLEPATYVSLARQRDLHPVLPALHIPACS